ncbi:MAG: prohibitin family protein [Chloroflexota bacterium]
MIDSLLDLITIIAWSLLGLYTLLFFVRTTQRHGVTTGLRRLLSFRLLLPLALVIGLNMLGMSLVYITPPQVGVVLSVTAPKGVRPQPIQSGLHWIIPFVERVTHYPIAWQTYTMSSNPLEGQEIGDDSITARTNDGQEVILDCSILFRLRGEQAVRIYIDWQERYITDFVRPVTRGIVRTRVSQFTVDEVNSSRRADLEAELNLLLEEEFRDKGLELDQFVLRNIAFSPEYASAIEHKQVAEQQILQKQHEAEQIRTLAEGEAAAVRIKAQAEADGLKFIADALAKDEKLLTHEYISKLSPGIRVILVPSDNPFLLPLPNMEPDEQPFPIGSPEGSSLGKTESPPSIDLQNQPVEKASIP